MQGDFNFTLGSRWQSKGAGVFTVKRVYEDGTADMVPEGAPLITHFDRRGRPTNGLLHSGYHLTGPADPQADGMRGEDLADGFGLAELQAIKDTMREQFAFAEGIMQRAAIEAVNAVYDALMAERSKRAGNMGGVNG